MLQGRSGAPWHGLFCSEVFFFFFLYAATYDVKPATNYLSSHLHCLPLPL